MKCPQCGRIIDDDSIYCDYCGIKALQANTLKKKTQIVESNTLPQQDESQLQQDYQDYYASKQQTAPQANVSAQNVREDSPSERKWVVVFLINCILVIIIAFGVVSEKMRLRGIGSEGYNPVDTVAMADTITKAEQQIDSSVVEDSVALETVKANSANVAEKAPRQREDAEMRAKEATEKARQARAKAKLDSIDAASAKRALQEAKDKAEAARIEEIRRAEEARKPEERKAKLKLQGWVDLGLPSGTLWKDKNERGYFSYAEAMEEFGSSLPTKRQWEELKNKCKWTWTRNGYRVKGPNGNYIVMPAAGFRNCSGIVYDVGSYGNYWSSTPDGSEGVWHLGFGSSGVGMFGEHRCLGQSVRLVR